MSRKLLSLFTILFIISAIAAPVNADQTVFGPEDLTIGILHVHLSSHPFSVDDPSDGVLTIVKNTPDKEIRGGFCFINGNYIGLSDFLEGTGTIFQGDVDLLSNSRITVFLRGTPDASIKIEIKKKGVTPPPEVTFTANPATIYVGQSSTLSWTSTNADTCVIEPGIGSVDLNGSTAVSPTETTTYTITATGTGGTAMDSLFITVSPPILLTITSPSDGENLNRPDVMVQGTVTNALSFETGLTVNGIVAMVDGNQFVANYVPLQEGENIITATATDTQGYAATKSIVINKVTTGDYIKITAYDESSVSPLETTLRINGSFSFTESSITDSGPGVVEFLSSSAEEYNIRIITPGIYYFTANVTDSQSNTYTDTLAVLVLDQAVLDALLRVKWEGMRSALTQNDVDTAVSYFDSSTKDAYQTVFTGNPQLLAQMAQVLNDIQFIRTEDNSAEYDIRAIKDGTEYSFYLLFIKDDKGLWKIKSF